MREFKVWRENDEEFDDGRKVRALDAESAAETWADEEDWSSADYLIVSQRDTPVVCVQGPEGTVRRYRVRGESVAVYTAREIMNGD